MFYNFLFRLVLWLIGLRLRWLGRNNAEVAALIREQEFSVQTCTQDGRVARTLRFCNGRVESLRGMVSSPSTTLSFLNAHVALTVLKALGSDQAAMLKAVQEHKLKIEGDFAKLILFIQVAQHIPRRKEAQVA